MALIKKPPLPLERHREIGRQLRHARETLMGIYNEIYGDIPAGSRNRMIKGIDQVFQIRDHLEKAMFRDYPRDASTKNYFGPSDTPVNSQDEDETGPDEDS